MVQGVVSYRAGYRSLACRAAALALAAGLASGARGDPIEVRGSVAEVTVYRGQALVTRNVAVGAPAGGGLVELVVTDLPERIVPASIFAESRQAGSVEVRSVRYRVRPVGEEVNDQVRAIDAKIRDLDDRLRATQKKTELLNQHRAYLDKLEQFVAPAATVELSKGVLNAETLKALTELLRSQRADLADQDLKLAIEQRDLAEQKDLAQRERANLTRGTSKTVREAVVLANVPAGAQAPALSVRYLVDQAGWTPSYTIRADEKKDKVEVEYYAAIQQMSGEDWGDVAMTLSTATPSLVSRAPELKPMTVSLAGAEPQGAPAVAYQAQKDEFVNRKREIDRSRAGGRPQNGPAGGVDAEASLNVVAEQEQMLDLLSRDKVVRVLAAAPPDRDGNLSVTYSLPSRTSLPSRADRQQVQIAAMSMPAEFYKVATPVLTEFVYDEAQATNSSALVLLTGPSATYVEGRFVGSGDVPTVSAGETFIVGFGIDSTLRASRELVEKNESVQGGNRVVDLAYRLAIENFGQQDAKVRLLDRLPKSKESEVKVTLVDPGKPLFSEGQEAASHKKTGILRWDVAAPAKASGDKALALEYRFRLEHDKQMSLAGLPTK
jgi:uncharacterized protein (TIGR02231 family)